MILTRFGGIGSYFRGGRVRDFAYPSGSAARIVAGPPPGGLHNDSAESRCSGHWFSQSPSHPSAGAPCPPCHPESCPRAAPRALLQARQTTAISDRRIALPWARRCHASGEWSAVRSSSLPQSSQNGWSRRARADSRAHDSSYPRCRRVPLSGRGCSAGRHNGHAPRPSLSYGVPQSEQIVIIVMSSLWLGSGG